MINDLTLKYVEFEGYTYSFMYFYLHLKHASLACFVANDFIEMWQSLGAYLNRYVNGLKRTYSLMNVRSVDFRHASSDRSAFGNYSLTIAATISMHYLCGVRATVSMLLLVAYSLAWNNICCPRTGPPEFLKKKNDRRFDKYGSIRCGHFTYNGWSSP